MLLKNGYRHVYISRKFALKHGFIPNDAAPGHYGYGGLVKYVMTSYPSWFRELIIFIFQPRKLAHQSRKDKVNAHRLSL